MKPIALDEDISSLTVGQTVRVSGWGTTSFQGSTSESLLYADLRYISNSACNNVYGMIDEFEMCTYEDGKDACQGDSGGPLVISEFTNGEPLLVGVVSWGYECASPGFPGKVLPKQTIMMMENYLYAYNIGTYSRCICSS